MSLAHQVATLQKTKTWTDMPTIKVVVRPRPAEPEKRMSPDELIQEMDRLRKLISAAWKGPADAVAEIRYQRTKPYDPDYR